MKPLTIALALLTACTPAGAQQPHPHWTTPPHHVEPAHLEDTHMATDADRRRYGITQTEMTKRHRQRMLEDNQNPDDPNSDRQLITPAELIALRRQ